MTRSLDDLDQQDLPGRTGRPVKWSRQSYEERLCAAVRARLGVDVTLARWEPNRDGSQSPVWVVPADRVAAARALGLLVEGGAVV